MAQVFPGEQQKDLPVGLRQCRQSTADSRPAAWASASDSIAAAFGRACSSASDQRAIAARSSHMSCSGAAVTPRRRGAGSSGCPAGGKPRTCGQPRRLAANGWQVRDVITADTGADADTATDRNVVLAIGWPRTAGQARLA